MLMSEVICLYYPLAGLVDTVGVYGIPVERGQEIETIVNLTNKRKTEIRKRGKEYALSCSWENRAKKWSNLLFLDNDSLNIEKRTFTNNNIENTDNLIFYENSNIQNREHLSLSSIVNNILTDNRLIDQHSFVLDPLSVIIKLAVLSNKPVGTKICISNNIIFLFIKI